jgi:hypothetical protein
MALRKQGLAWDEALAGLEAARMLGSSEPEVAGCVDNARSIFVRLDALPLLARLDEAVSNRA